MSADTDTSAEEDAAGASAPVDKSFSWFLVHAGFSQFATNLASVFLVPYLLQRGTPIAVIFLSVAATLAGRFCLRPLVVVLAKATGLRGAMIVGTLVSTLQFPALAQVDGVGPWLFIWIAATALGDVIYWTIFHTLHARLGDAAKLGHQTGLRQTVFTISGIAAPLIGGVLLARFPGAAAFWLAAGMRAVSALPLLRVRDPDFPKAAPPNAYRAGRFGAAVFVTDGWCACGAGIAWGAITFVALREQFDMFGYALSAAGLAGALGGLVIGKLVDFGRADRAVAINLGAMLGVNAAQATSGSPVAIVATMLAGSVAGGFSAPAMMPAIYGIAREAPCTLRFQVTTEGGWDVGAISAATLAAGLVALGAPLRAIILLAAPALIIQALLLHRKYRARELAAAAGD